MWSLVQAAKLHLPDEWIKMYRHVSTQELHNCTRDDNDDDVNVEVNQNDDADDEVYGDDDDDGL